MFSELSRFEVLCLPFSVGHFPAIIHFNISFPFSLSSPSDIPIVHRLHLLKLSHRSPFFSCYSLQSFSCHIIKLNNSFLCWAQPADEHIEGIFHSCYSGFISSISVWLFLSVPCFCLHNSFVVLVWCSLFPLEPLTY